MHVQCRDQGPYYISADQEANQQSRNNAQNSSFHELEQTGTPNIASAYHKAADHKEYVYGYITTVDTPVIGKEKFLLARAWEQRETMAIDDHQCGYDSEQKEIVFPALQSVGDGRGG